MSGRRRHLSRPQQRPPSNTGFYVAGGAIDRFRGGGGRRQTNNNRRRPSRSYLAASVLLALSGSALFWCAFQIPFTNSRYRSRNKNSETTKKNRNTERNAITQPASEASPWNSHPPEPIDLAESLNATNIHPAILQRHRCLQEIRSRIETALAPIVLANAAKKERALLVDPAYHKNVGDHMITVAETLFLNKLLLPISSSSSLSVWNYSTTLPFWQQCHYWQAHHFVPDCESLLLEQQQQQQQPRHEHHPPALWHGGGNWGDLWRQAQEVRIQSLSSLLFANYTIISMPQSLHYRNKNLEAKDAADIRTNIARGLRLLATTENTAQQGKRSDPLISHDDVLDSDQGRRIASSRVFFSWRERESYEKALQLYPYVTNLLVPDIAFLLGPYGPLTPSPPPPSDRNIKRNNRHEDEEEDMPPPVDILLFLRNDQESVVPGAEKGRQFVRSVLSDLGDSSNSGFGAGGIRGGVEQLSFSIVDWVDRLDRFSSHDIFFTRTSVDLLRLGTVVICDRLHAAILAYLSGRPFLYLDPETGKISKTLGAAFATWPEGCGDGSASNWARADNVTHAIELAVQFLATGTFDGKDVGADSKSRRRLSQLLPTKQ